MKLPKFKIGQKVWCFVATGYWVGVVRSIATKNIFDPECEVFEYTVLLDAKDLGDDDGSAEVFDEDNLTADPLTAHEAKRCKAETTLASLKSRFNYEADYIKRQEAILEERKRQQYALKEKMERLEKIIKEAK